MFTTRITNEGGMPRWIMAVARWVEKKRKGGPLRKGDGTERKEPKTEGERALYQAMGWKSDGWE